MPFLFKIAQKESCGAFFSWRRVHTYYHMVFVGLTVNILRFYEICGIFSREGLISQTMLEETQFLILCNMVLILNSVSFSA